MNKYAEYKHGLMLTVYKIDNCVLTIIINQVHNVLLKYLIILNKKKNGENFSDVYIMQHVSIVTCH